MKREEISRKWGRERWWYFIQCKVTEWNKLFTRNRARDRMKASEFFISTSPSARNARNRHPTTSSLSPLPPPKAKHSFFHCTCTWNNKKKKEWNRHSRRHRHREEKYTYTTYIIAMWTKNTKILRSQKHENVECFMKNWCVMPDERRERAAPRVKLWKSKSKQIGEFEWFEFQFP